MNKSKIALLIAVATVLAPLGANAGTADDAHIRALEARFAAAVEARDIDAIMKVYSSDVFVFDVVLTCRLSSDHRLLGDDRLWGSG